MPPSSTPSGQSCKYPPASPPGRDDGVCRPVEFPNLELTGFIKGIKRRKILLALYVATITVFSKFSKEMQF